MEMTNLLSRVLGTPVPLVAKPTDGKKTFRSAPVSLRLTQSSTDTSKYVCTSYVSIDIRQATGTVWID